MTIYSHYFTYHQTAATLGVEQNTRFQLSASFKMCLERKKKFSIVSGERLSTQRADLQENIHRTARPSPGQSFHTQRDAPSALDYYVFCVHKIPVVSLSGDASTCSKSVR